MKGVLSPSTTSPWTEGGEKATQQKKQAASQTTCSLTLNVSNVALNNIEAKLHFINQAIERRIEKFTQQKKSGGLNKTFQFEKGSLVGEVDTRVQRRRIAMDIFDETMHHTHKSELASVVDKYTQPRNQTSHAGGTRRLP